MGDEIARTVLLVGAIAVFFALVCPLAVDPIAVGKVERLADAAAPAPSLLPTIVPQISQPTAALEGPVGLAAPLDLAELSCVLTC